MCPSVPETSESLETHILAGGSRLQIARSQPSDSGPYTCVASNIEGEARKSYHLLIQGTTQQQLYSTFIFDLFFL